ncbi:MAG: hypothetical protein F9K35_08510 [Burkholderiaceae bacterium]|nr:MAG: hypothetical protein F9K35_08510 [Burkholderiaceae bacterium]
MARSGRPACRNYVQPPESPLAPSPFSRAVRGKGDNASGRAKPVPRRSLACPASQPFKESGWVVERGVQR